MSELRGSKFSYGADDNLMILPSEPRSLRSDVVITARRQSRSRYQMKPLNDFVADLRAEGRGFVPDFDPFDGGVGAEILFLMEKPGPKTDPRNGGSGFVSRDNNDRTAETIFVTMANAGIGRGRTLIWNLIPWWNGEVKFVGDDCRDGLKRFADLLRILPDLRSVAAVGTQAAKARLTIENAGLAYHESAHPSPVVRATNRRLWHAIPDQWKAAYESLEEG